MASRQIMQFRYYAEDSDNNFPEGLASTGLEYGTIFKNYAPILQLGVQALPGTKFFLNGNLDPIVIGQSGIYELDLTNSTASISTLTFDPASIEIISENDNAWLLIDVIYGG